MGVNNTGGGGGGDTGGRGAHRVTESGMVTDVSAVHPEKAKSPMLREGVHP